MKEHELTDSRSVAATVSRFAHEVFRAGAPDDVERKVVELIADQVGLQTACATLPWSTAVFEYVKKEYEHVGAGDGPGSATVRYHGTRTCPEQAAFVNSAFGHGQDFDDTCQLVQTHAGAVVISAAVAVGESVDATGREVLRATTAGLEIMLRVAHAVSPGCLRRGHHTPPATGPFGAAIAAGLLLGLDEARLEQALAVAGSFSGGLTEYTQAGGSVKRIHTAIPSAAGIRAAELARRGITGPLTVFEGNKGFVNVYTDTSHPERLTADLHERFVIENVGLKAYNCCYFIHAPIDSLREIMARGELEAEDIAAIEVGTSAHGVTHVGSLPDPVDAVGGQFSMHFTLALVADGHLPGLDSYTDEQFRSPKLRNLASLVWVYEDETAEFEYPSNWGCHLIVRSVSGEVFSNRVRYPIGTPENPISESARRGKFLSNLIAAGISEHTANSVYDRIVRIDEQVDLRPLLADVLPVPRAVEVQSVMRGHSELAEQLRTTS